MNSDCYYTIISFLDIKNIHDIALVNKQFYIISRNELIWKSFYNDKFSNINCGRMFYLNYIKCHKLNKFLIEHKMDITKINKELDLYHNQLQSMPLEIGQLNMLQELYLYNNQLHSIPPEIGQLNMLHTLGLHNNQLQSIPPEIGQLKMLQTLHLYNNQLHSIPPEIGQLNMLQILYLGNTQLELVPENFNRDIIQII
jgi:Leucine-rich repeat (LRR) protein